MKFCKDCKYHEARISGGSYDRCWYNPEVNLITGKHKPKSCSLERTYSFGKCGKKARFFVPIVPEPVDTQPEVQHNQGFFSKIVKFFKRS